MRFFTVLVVIAVLGYVKSKKKSSGTFCTKYTVDDEGGLPDGYYERMIPENCRAKHLQNWRPTYKIDEPWSNCKGGWRKYKESCYRLAIGNKDVTFRDGEVICNENQGHQIVFKDREEFMWIHNNIANQNKWYFVGLFCGQGKDIANAYVVTGEDMTKIGGNWGFQMRQPLDMHNNPCAMWHRNNAAWMKNFHHQNCATAHGVICESPLGG